MLKIVNNIKKHHLLPVVTLFKDIQTGVPFSAKLKSGNFGTETSGNWIKLTTAADKAGDKLFRIYDNGKIENRWADEMETYVITQYQQLQGRYSLDK